MNMPGISIVVPTWNRSALVDSLLSSLEAERSGYQGDTEVIVVDNSDGEQGANIESSCAAHDARYIRGSESVRSKRNLGVSHARFEIVLFLDSDVVAEPGLLHAHAEAYERGDHVGAVQGLTVFTGKGGFWWKVAELSGLMESFDNARKYPFQSWSIANNLSVRKDVFNRIGGFEEQFPFRLGGDDLEMSYRIAKSGALIASASDAVSLHSKETWDNVQALLDRSKRWGRMETEVCALHPELLKRVMPKNYVFECIALFGFGLCSLVANSAWPFACWAIWITLLALYTWWNSISGFRRITRVPEYIVAKLIKARYELFRLAGHRARGERSAMLKGMVFNVFQVKYGLAGESRRLLMLLVLLLFSILITGMVAYLA